MTEAFQQLVRDVLVIHEIEPELFQAIPASPFDDRPYGGTVAAQSLLAAGRTTDADRPAHSLHVSFLRAADYRAPALYQVERTRDSGSFSSRLVRVQQHGRTIAVVLASFHRARPGLEHQIPCPEAPAPETLTSRVPALVADRGDEAPANARVPWPIDIRYVDHRPWLVNGNREPVNRSWLRADGPLPDDPLIHAAALAFASDLTMFEPVLFPHELNWTQLVSSAGVYGATIEHTLWFHRSFRADRWLLETQASPVASNSRALTTGHFFDRDGHLVATAAQEIMLMVSRS